MGNDELKRPYNPIDVDGEGQPVSSLMVSPIRWNGRGQSCATAVYAKCGFVLHYNISTSNQQCSEQWAVG